MLTKNNIILKDPMVIIEERRFSYVGKYKPELIPRGAKRIDYDHGLLIPPFINSHTHLPETLIRGICDDEDLHTWLYDHVWKVESKMTKQDVNIGTKLGIAEMVQSGSIGFIDQFYFSKEMAKVIDQTGVKAMLAPSIFDGNPESKTIEKSFKLSIKTFEKWNGFDNRIFVGFGPHATYTVPEDLFKEIIHKANEIDTFLHTHLNETKRDIKNARQKWGMSEIEKMAQWGGLSRTLAAHCINVNSSDIKLLQSNNTTVLHNCKSNLKLGSGIAPIPKFIKNKINVCLGTDGSASNNNLSILEEIRLVSLLHKGLNNNPKIISIMSAFQMATKNPAKIFPNNSYTGEITINSPGDLVVFDLKSLQNTPVINPLSNLVYSSQSSDVSLTVSNGKVLYENGDFPNFDIEKIKIEAQDASMAMMNRANYQPHSTAFQ